MSLPAKVIADFELIEKVGQGGMGAVYRARQISMHRVVALKILAPKFANDEKFKARFMREARVSAKLNHLNIINGIECGEEGGVTFFAMEFVDGVTARQMLKERGKFPLQEAARIARQVAEALAYVHKNSIIHRDIKPDNIMITKDGTAKLCDLGLAKLTETEEEALSGDAEHDNESNPELTRSGQTMGTPYYISPEQAKGKKNVDVRADIYCLGGTLYHMLTGRAPFSGKNSMEIMSKHLTGEAPGLCELEPTISDDWGWVITQMMAKNPEDRYADPKELIQDLESAIDGKPVKARSFKGRSSCAAPRSGKKAAKVAVTATATKKPARNVDEDTPVRETTMQLPPRVPRSSARSEQSHLGLILGGVAALVLVVAAASVLGGGTKPSNTGSTNTKNASLQQEAKVDRPSATPPPSEKHPPAVKENSPPAQTNTAPKQNAEEPKETREKHAAELLEKARNVEKAAPNDFAALLPALASAEEAATDTPAVDETALLKKSVEERWAGAIDAELKKIADAVEPLLKKKDFAAAAAAADRDKVPEALRVLDWEQRLSAVRKPLADSAEAAAAKIVAAAQLAAGAADDAEKLDKAVALLAPATAIPAALAPSAEHAAQLRQTWSNKATEIRKAIDATRSAQLVIAREKLRPAMKKLIQMLKDSSFASVLDFLEKQRLDPANSDIKEVLKREKEDLQSVLALRQSAFDTLKAKIGEKVRLHNRRDVMQATLKESTQPNRLTLVLSQGSTDAGPESLDPVDVLAFAAPREDGSDLKPRALLLITAGDMMGARETLQKARDAGQADAVALYLDYFDVLDVGEQEYAAKKAWADAEKLYDAKKFGEAHEAYVAFQKQFSRTKICSEVFIKLNERLAITDGAEASKPDSTKKDLKDTKGTYLSDMDEENVKMGFGKFGRNGDLTIENRRVQVNGEKYEKALYMRPAHRGSASVTYPLDKNYSTFKTRVALDDFSPGSTSPLTFKVFGDGKLLWTSDPIQKPRRHQETTLDVSGVEKLELRVEAKESSQDGHAVWLDPQVFK